MELKSILVAVGCGQAAKSAIKDAVALARSDGAHLLGLHAIDVALFPGYVDSDTDGPLKHSPIGPARHIESAK